MADGLEARRLLPADQPLHRVRAYYAVLNDQLECRTDLARLVDQLADSAAAARRSTPPRTPLDIWNGVPLP